MLHATDELRTARLGWNVLLNLRNYSDLSEDDLTMINHAMDEMNKNGLFEKPGRVLQGPIPGDTEEMLDGNG